MPKSEIICPDGTLAVECEVIPVHYMTDIDAGWTFTDNAGHPHHCDYEAADHYPTLRTVIDERYWCGECGDEHELTHLTCRQCDEIIQPGMTGPGTKFVPGPVHYTWNGEPISKDRAELILADWQAGRG